MRTLLATLLLASAPAFAQSTADRMENGQALASRWCSNCHLVGAGGPGTASDAVPSFAAIAARPGITAEGVATFLRVPHATMPDHGLTARQAQDLATYLLAQRPR